MCALRVPADDELRVGAPLVVRGDLRDAGLPARLDRAAVLDLEGVVEGDVLVVAAGEPRADGLHQLALAPRVRLVVAARQEDVDVGARARSRLLRAGDERQETSGGG